MWKTSHVGKRLSLSSIMDNLAITCDEIIESCDRETNFNEKKATCKAQNLYIFLVVLLITMT